MHHIHISLALRIAQEDDKLHFSTKNITNFESNCLSESHYQTFQDYYPIIRLHLDRVQKGGQLIGFKHCKTTSVWRFDSDFQSAAYKILTPISSFLKMTMKHNIKGWQ